MDVKNLKTLFLENKTDNQTIFKNAFWLGIAEIITKGTGVIIAIWLARHFGPSIYGQWAFALSFTAIAGILADFGLSTLAIREIAREKPKTSQYINNIAVMKLPLAALTFGLIAITAHFLGKEPEVVELIYLAGIFTIGNSFFFFLQAIFRAHEKMQYETICQGAKRLAIIGLATFFILNQKSIFYIGFSYITAVLVGILISLIFLWPYLFRPLSNINLKTCKETFSKAWPFGLSAIAALIYLYMDSVMLGIIRTSREVGWYSGIYQIIIGALLFAEIIENSFFPKLSQKHKENLNSLKKSVDKFIKVMQFFALPIAIVGTILGSKIIIFLYGKEYLPALFAFWILLWTLAVIYIKKPFESALQAADRQKLYLKIVATGAGLNIILNFLLIPGWGINGAALATFLTEVTLLIFMHYWTNKIIYNPTKIS